MADEPSPNGRQMSLIPYAHDSREIILRRGNAVVVYDASSRQLSVRASDDPDELSECPYCHQPLRAREHSADDGEHGRAFGPERPVVNPDYFGMLAASQRPSPAGSGQSTPSRRVHQAIRSGRSREVSATVNPPSGLEFVGSEPSADSGQGISASAFSPGYFQQFFREERELGRGGNGVVLLVEHMIDSVSLGHFACKRIPVGDSRAYFEKVIIEVRLLQKIPHKNLVAYHWTWLEDHQPTKFGPSIPCLWILQDYCNGGDLHSYVQGPGVTKTTTEKLKDRIRRKSKANSNPPQDLRGPSKLAFDEIFSFFRDITSGLHHLHSKGYIHRDLKPSNCLLQRDGGRTRVLISDFGEVQAAGSARGSSGATGTISYCAPEVLQKNADGSFQNFTTKSDIFSLGMIVYFMCFGRLPYVSVGDITEEGEDLDELRAEITNWPGFNEEARARPDLPERLYRYLRKLLSVDPNERPSTDEILSSIKGSSSSGESEWSPEDYSPRVSSMDSPAPKPPPRSRRSSYISRTGLPSPGGRHGTGDNTRARSPIKQGATRTGAISPLDSTFSLGSSKKMEMSPTTTEAEPMPPQTPRLMLPPPPPSRLDWLTRFVHEANTIFRLRIVMFLIKLLSLMVPCAPYAARKWLLYPLIGLASLDLGLMTFGLRRSMILLALHMTIVLIASQHSRLCEAGNIIVWEEI